jgi:uncharacterized protein (DUF58 family)
VRRIDAPTRPRSFADLLDAQLVARLSQLDVSSRKIFAGKLKGERRSKKRGESVEFADHRPYVVGDDLRHIDWNIFGRLDRLFLKLFLEDEDLALHIVLDASVSSDCGDPSKFFFAQKAAAALAYIGLVNLNRVTLTALAGGVPAGPDAEVEYNAPPPLRNLRGRRRLADVERWICALEPRGATNFPESARRIALQRSGKGVMVVISDFFFKEGYEQGLRYLSGRGYDVVLIQALSPQEVEPDLTGDLRLKDAEDGDLAEVTISAPLLKRYKANLSAYVDQLRTFCARREMTLMTVQSDTAIDVLLLDYLRRRGVLR